MDVFEGNLIGGGIEAASAKNLQESQQQWMTNMSNTAYQRQVADMKAAGLNPMLAATGGGSGGASTPQAPAGKPPGSAIAGAIQSGLAMRQNQQAVNNDTGRAIAEVTNKSADTELKRQDTLMRHEQTIGERQRSVKSAFEKEKLRQDMEYNEKAYQKSLELMNLEMDQKIAAAKELRSRSQLQREQGEKTYWETAEKRFKGRAWETAEYIGDRLQGNAGDRDRDNAATGKW